MPFIKQVLCYFPIPTKITSEWFNTKSQILKSGILKPVYFWYQVQISQSWTSQITEIITLSSFKAHYTASIILSLEFTLHIFCYRLTTGSGILPQKLQVVHPVNKFPKFHGSLFLHSQQTLFHHCNHWTTSQAR